jgi:hypothetical protein
MRAERADRACLPPVACLPPSVARHSGQGDRRPPVPIGVGAGRRVKIRRRSIPVRAAAGHKGYLVRRRNPFCFRDLRRAPDRGRPPAMVGVSGNLRRSDFFTLLKLGLPSLRFRFKPTLAPASSLDHLSHLAESTSPGKVGRPVGLSLARSSIVAVIVCGVRPERIVERLLPRSVLSATAPAQVRQVGYPYR